MKPLTEAERKLHLANCCQWKFDSYTIDDEGMPKDCVLVNEINSYLPDKVVMVPKRICQIVDISERRGTGCNHQLYQLSCGHFIEKKLGERFYFCEQCGAELCGAEIVDD